MSDLVGNPEDRFSQNEAHITDDIKTCNNGGLIMALGLNLLIYGVLF